MNYTDLFTAIYTPLLDLSIVVNETSGGLVTPVPVPVKVGNFDSEKGKYSVSAEIEMDEPLKESKEGTQSFNATLVCEISVPVKSGWLGQVEIADQIRSAYPLNRFLESGTAVAEVVGCGIGDSERSEEHYIRPLEIQLFIVEKLN